LSGSVGSPDLWIDDRRERFQLSGKTPAFNILLKSLTNVFRITPDPYLINSFKIKSVPSFYVFLNQRYYF
jgi:hypothetical protein